MKIVDNHKQPETMEECKNIWCKECVYDKDLECEGVKRGWVE